MLGGSSVSGVECGEERHCGDNMKVRFQPELFFWRERGSVAGQARPTVVILVKIPAWLFVRRFAASPRLCVVRLSVGGSVEHAMNSQIDPDLALAN